jgi:hypothetical protein
MTISINKIPTKCSFCNDRAKYYIFEKGFFVTKFYFVCNLHRLEKEIKSS